MCKYSIIAIYLNFINEIERQKKKKKKMAQKGDPHFIYAKIFK